MSNIHPTAIVADTATLGKNITIEPYAIISDHVEIGDNCIIESHAVIKPFVKMGNDNNIGSHSVIGGVPQDISFDPQQKTFLEIGHGNTLRENVTIHRSTDDARPTRLGNGCYLMAYTHIAHDCLVGNKVIMANVATLAGFVEVGDGVFVGGGVMVHQHVRIGSMAMIGGALAIVHDVMPCALVGEQPPRQRRINSTGLQRAGFSPEKIATIEAMFTCLARGESIDHFDDNDEVKLIKAWLEGGKRPLMKFANNI